MMLTYADAARRLDLRNGRARCPAHGGTHLSLAVWEAEDSRLGLKCWSAGCDYTDIAHAIMRMPLNRENGASSPDASSPFRSVGAYRLWREARSASGTPVEVYLKSRGITATIPPTVRYHPKLKHTASGTTHPGMICAVATGEMTYMHALQRTYLCADGAGKADISPNKMSLGQIAGGSFRTAPGGPQLLLTEGVEDALTLSQVLGLPAWATLGASNLAKVWLPPLPMAVEVIIAVDGDQTGESVALAARDRFTREGRRVRLMRPPEGIKDFNDVLRDEARDD